MFEVVDTLDITLRLLESECEQTIAVFDDRTSMTLKGYIRHLDLMTAYNDALTNDTVTLLPRLDHQRIELT